RQTGPSDFWFGEHHRRYDDILKRAALTGNHLDRHARLPARLVRQKHSAGNVTDGIDVGVGRLLLRVDLDETFVIALNLRVLQTEVAAIRHAADGHQHPVVKFFAL